MKITALFNPSAGGVGQDGERRLRQALAEAGHPQAEIIPFDAGEGMGQVSRIAASQPDMLIVWGGDGTHRTALTACRGTFSRLLLLPGGTMNLLTRWLHAQQPWPVVLRNVIRRAAPRSLNAGDVGGNLFFCALIAGVPAQVAKAREDLRVGNFGRAIQDVNAALEEAGHIHLTTRIGDKEETPSGNLVAALVGPLGQSQDGIDIVRMTLPTNLGALGLAWSCLRSDWHHAASADVHAVSSFTISDADGQDIPAMMDGEMVRVGPTLTARFQRNAATCLVASEPGAI